LIYYRLLSQKVPTSDNTNFFQVFGKEVVISKARYGNIWTLNTNNESISITGFWGYIHQVRSKSNYLHQVTLKVKKISKSNNVNVFVGKNTKVSTTG
jgi:hypothetical protein